MNFRSHKNFTLQKKTDVCSTFVVHMYMDICHEFKLQLQASEIQEFRYLCTLVMKIPTKELLRMSCLLIQNSQSVFESFNKKVKIIYTDSNIISQEFHQTFYNNYIRTYLLLSTYKFHVTFLYFGFKLIWTLHVFSWPAEPGDRGPKGGGDTCIPSILWQYQKQNLLLHTPLPPNLPPELLMNRIFRFSTSTFAKWHVDNVLIDNIYSVNSNSQQVGDLEMNHIFHIIHITSYGKVRNFLTVLSRNQDSK